MKFDPTYNYGNADLSKDENNILWRFGEMIKTLVTMKSDAERQKEIIGIGAVADEMAEDFHTYFTLSYRAYTENNLLTSKQKNKLDELDLFLDVRSGDNSPEFWDDFNLSTNSAWEFVRKHAKEILVMLNMDDLALEFEREEKYETTLKGKKIISQSTKTRLVRKTNN